VFAWLTCLGESPNTPDELTNRDTYGTRFDYSAQDLTQGRLWWAIALFEALTALMHGALGWCLSRVYIVLIEQNLQPFRWIEYSLTATIMFVIIASLSGISDVFLLLSLGLNCIFMNICGGWLVEVLSLLKQSPLRAGLIYPTQLGLILLGWVAVALMFVATFSAFEHSISPYFDYGSGHLWGELFGFIRSLNFALCLSFMTFPVIHTYQFLHPEAYARAEGLYIICSFISKGLLVVIVGAASLRRE